MGLITKNVIVKWSFKNRKYFVSKGYEFTKWKDEFEVKVSDLTENSGRHVKVQCDNCFKFLTLSLDDYNRHKKDTNKYYCKECAYELYGKKNAFDARINNSISFYDWCYKNLDKSEADEIMQRWDYDLNKCNPKDVSYSSTGINHEGYYFKCLKHLNHKSELKNINSFTNKKRNIRKLKCDQCNSFAQWGIDNICLDFLNKYWDYSKNININPFDIDKSCGKYIYIYCQEKSYHGSYKIRCADFYNGKRCGYCGNHHGKVHKFDSLGFLYPKSVDVWDYSINKKSPYQYAPFSSKQISWKCENKKHKEYNRSISASVKYNFRCPECVRERKESIIQEKVRNYIEDKYDCNHEYKCTLIPINPKTKCLMPFDNEIIIENKHLIIEVHGEQHYDIRPYMTIWRNDNSTPEQQLHKRKLYDRYKKYVAYCNGYFYMAIPYWDIEKSEKYKKDINNKIQEILKGGEERIDSKFQFRI